MSETKKYMPWQNAGGPNECKHGYAAGIPCPHCDATKGVEDGMGDGQAVRQVYPDARDCPSGRGEHMIVSGQPGWYKYLSRDHHESEEKAWADAARRIAAVPVAIPSAPATTEVRGKASPEMEELRDALKRVILWCPRGWSIDLDIAMTAARKALDHIEGKG